MWIVNNNKQTWLPKIVTLDGHPVDPLTLTPAQLDSIGINQFVPIDREPHHVYKIATTKDDDYIIREEALDVTEDSDALTAQQANSVRMYRDTLLSASDWAILPDCPLDQQTKSLWIDYRQALRDMPQQQGFPWGGDLDQAPWPQMPGADAGGSVG